MENDILTQALINVGATEAEAAFVMDAVIAAANKLNGDVYYLNTQITNMSKQRVSLQDDVVAIQSLSNKIGITFPAFPSPELRADLPPLAVPIPGSSAPTSEAPAEAPAETPAT